MTRILSPAPASPRKTPLIGHLTAIDLQSLHPEATFLRIFGANYIHLNPRGEGDLYITEHGLPFVDQLMPENWYEDQWFKANRQRLEGTSAVYRVLTRPLPGHQPQSLDIVVKWSRVGQDIPLDTFTLDRAVNCEFNTPFEEFSLVEEMRRGDYGPKNIHILTQKPLAIYVPPEKLQLWQTGRSREKILCQIARHPGVEIDILRSYILLYGWIKGVNAVEAYHRSFYDASRQETQLAELTQTVHDDLHKKGFIVADHKPSHFIVRPGKNGIRRRDGRIAYALVDYELLARTPDHENAVRASGRSAYLNMMRDRFKPPPLTQFPAHLKPVNVLGVDYVYGRTESTGGALWVVGSNPELFNYFLPERWRTKPVKLSQTNQTYYSCTKDRIHLVWKISRVGEFPPGAMTDPRYKERLIQGFNSPFEEFALALQICRKGLRTTYPRAIYVTGQPSGSAGYILDRRRFERLAHLAAPDETPILPLDHDFITIWGYWRGLEDDEAPTDSGYWTPIDALQATTKGLLPPDILDKLVEEHRTDLAAAGFRDSGLRGDHILLSYRPAGAFKQDPAGRIERRQCNLELVRHI
ncbi:MAG: hypothetical protein NTU53_14000 [Planctomycetota bacterium]|nr:hypothetical protein [Planctomycetota bacterium]